jgi:hypothetical protein
LFFQHQLKYGVARCGISNLHPDRAAIFQRKIMHKHITNTTAAILFFTELLDSVETLTGVADLYGARTLADLMYLQNAILKSSSISFYMGESMVLEIARGLPSGDQWVKFIAIEDDSKKDAKSPLDLLEPGWYVISGFNSDVLSGPHDTADTAQEQIDFDQVQAGGVTYLAVDRGLITQARITALPKTLSDPMPTVFVTTGDGKEQELFTYYPDEISFAESEFIGLTLQQANDLRHKKDVAFLRSPS